MSEPKFKIGDKVRHKSGAEFQMVVKGFAVAWFTGADAFSKKMNNVPNPEYPICSYYNNKTNKWEEKYFLQDELDLIEEAK